jgi:hypothetical protein
LQNTGDTVANLKLIADVAKAIGHGAKAARMIGSSIRAAVAAASKDGDLSLTERATVGLETGPRALLIVDAFRDEADKKRLLRKYSTETRELAAAYLGAVIAVLLVRDA